MTPAELYPGFDLNAPAINAPIEEGVKPLCDALNALPGVYTIWSCEGHSEVGSRPYATFIASSETAFAVHRAVSGDKSDAGLHYCWNLTATFRDDGTLQYTIEPNDYRLVRDKWASWLFPRRRWSNQAMAGELGRLAELVRNLK